MPLIPKFASEGAAKVCERRNRDTSAEVTTSAAIWSTPARGCIQHIESLEHFLLVEKCLAGCSIVTAARARGDTALLRWLGTLALIAPSLAFAQSPIDFDRMFGHAQDALVQAATQSEWNAISSSEIACIDDALRQQGGSVETLTQRGVMPSDPRIGGITSNCRSELGRQGPSVPIYAVSGLAVGARVQFGSSAYRDYKCGPSDQFDGFTWCQKAGRGKEPRGSFNVAHSLLHSPEGRVVYVNRNQAPAFFSPTEADEDIDRYSRRIGERPRVIVLPPRPELSRGILATWGKIVLEPLDSESLKKLAQGERPNAKGYFIDFIGDFARSAKEGLPIYRLSGGAGFVWVASYDQKGRGILRFAAVDASAISAQLVAAQGPTIPPDQQPRESPSIAPSPAIRGDEAEQRETAEARTPGNLANAPRALQFLMKGLRTTEDFINLAEENFLAAFSDLEADELRSDTFADATRVQLPKTFGKTPGEIVFLNFRQCFFLSDSGCNRTYGMLSGVMPTLNPALREVIEQSEPIREFKYEGRCFFSATLHIKKSLLEKNSDGSYRRDQTGHVAYFLNFNGIDPNSIKIVDAAEYIKIALEPPRSYLDPGSSPHWQARYERFISSMIEATRVRKFVILEKKKADHFPNAPVSLLLADLGEPTDEEHAWSPVNYFEEKYPFAIERSSLKRFPVLAFEAADADLIFENLSNVIQSCQNDR